MKRVITIEGMHCSHCSARVEKALRELGLDVISVDLAAKSATVEGGAAENLIREAIEDIGFEFVSIA